MRSSVVLALTLVAGCSSPAVVVYVDNPQGLPIAHEHVRVDAWDNAGHLARSATHDFTVNGNLGSFAVELVHAQSGRLRVSVDFTDATGASVGRATGTLALTGSRRTDLHLRATRLLSGPHAAIVAGVPGGAGDRDGPTGPDPTLPARLDHPLAFGEVGQAGVGGAIGLILESCGAIRRLTPQVGINVLDTIVPCSRHTPPANAGALSNLSLDNPTTLVVDPYGPTVYIGDGARILAVHYTSIDADPTMLTYVDFTFAAGAAPMHVADLALGPYHDRTLANSPPYDTLYVADDVANVVWAYPLSGGARTIALGQTGDCVATLSSDEQAHPPSGASWTPGPFIAPTQAHLCQPTHLDTGALGGAGSQAVLFVGDTGHGNMRMVVPNALNGGPGVTTIFDGYPALQAFGYRFLGNNVVLAGTEIGAMFFWNQNQLNYFMVYSNPTISGVGLTNRVSSAPAAGYTPSFNILSALGAQTMGLPLDVRFADVEHVLRVTDAAQGDAVVSRSFMLFAERNNAVVKNINLNLDVAPWVGAGPSYGLDAASTTTLQPLFAGPAGLAWNGSNTVYVADRDNHAIAAVRYDGSALPLKGVEAHPLAGCPRYAGDVDGAAGNALLRQPIALAFDAADDVLFVLDDDGDNVRRVQLDGNGAASAVHPLVGADVNDGTACPTTADGGLPAVDPAADGGTAAPGSLGRASALAFDATRRTLWLAHSDSPDLVAVDVDAGTPRTVPLPAGAPPAVQLAVIDATLFALGADGSLSTVDLLSSNATAVAQPPLMLSGAVTAAGTDGEWLYVADDGARVWRVDPLALAATPTQLIGDGAHGLVAGQTPGINRVGGIAYDGARGVLLVSDHVENALVAVQ